MNKEHKLTLLNRSNCSINGIKELLSSNEKDIILETIEGMLMIKGKDLKISSFDINASNISIFGKLDSFTYAN